MAAMDLDAVLQDLNRRFSEPLPEFYARRIIFWYDEDREFEDKLEDVELPDAKLVVLTGSNSFAVKKLLCEDDTESNYLVYDPLSYPRDDDNWLINLELYSEEFRADLNPIWMEEMGISSSPILRKQMKAYRKFFNAKPRREAVRKLNTNISTVKQLQLAVMAVLCGNTSMEPYDIVKAVLGAGLDQQENRIYQSMVNFGVDETFWNLIAQGIGYHSEQPDLGQAAVHLLLTAATRTMHTDNLAGLGDCISLPHQANCYDIVSEWIHSDDKPGLYDIARFAEDKTRLLPRFRKLAVEDLIATECFPCVNECILLSLMTEIRDHIINVDLIKKTIEKRRSLSWYQPVSCYFEALLQVANMQSFFLEHAAGFHTMEPFKIWKEYTTDYYRMDSYYRQFHLCFQKSLTATNPLLDDLFKQVADKVEGLYSNWFIDSLCQNWTSAAEQNLAEYGRILEVPQQRDFYRSKVQNCDSRVYVIVSDALRYEVAASLSDQLRLETQSKVNLSSCEAVFPTITKCGMAALLPSRKLEIIEKEKGQFQVLADGVPTDANYRDQILKQANKRSAALKYTDLIRLKRAERQELVKGMDVVYIFHDKVDEASHSADTSVFTACETAIAEIKNLVRIIVNDFGGTRIYITADHGFLYTYSPLREEDKLSKAAFRDRILEYGRRYVIMKKGENPDYLMPVKLFDENCGLSGYAPREDIRIKMSGGGMNFVHGGVSLQEMVVPVIEYQYLRSSSKEYQKNKAAIDTKPVSLTLLSTQRKISNMIFSLNFYQTEPVGGNRESASYKLYFEDEDGNVISDICKVLADKTSENGQERTFRCSFNLKSQSYDSLDLYYLVIADESGLQAPVKKEFQINIAFAVDDFGFF